MPKAKRNEFVDKVEEMFDKVTGPVVLICGRNKIETASKGREKFVSLSLRWLALLLLLISKLYFVCERTDDDTPKLWPHCETGMLAKT